jgi:putative FmdB family regulatory protein
MPVYEYECGECGKGFEELIRTPSEELQVACPECGSRRPIRRPSVFAAHGPGVATSAPSPRSACGRCGDPDGPCARE